MNITLDSYIPQNLTAIIYIPDYRDVDRGLFSRSSLEIFHYDRNRRLVSFIDRIWEYIKVYPFKQYITPEITILFNGNHVSGVWEEDGANPKSSLTYNDVSELEYTNIAIETLIKKTLSDRTLLFETKRQAQKLAEEKAKQEAEMEKERQEYERLKKKFDKPHIFVNPKGR